MGNEKEQRPYYNNVTDELRQVDNSFDNSKKKCNFLKGLNKKACEKGV